MEHTKTPWTQYGYQIVGAEGTPEARVVALMAYGSISPAPPFDCFNSEHRQEAELVQANANHILCAVNAHEPLLEALKKIEEETLKDWHIHSTCGMIAILDLMRSTARAAIAKATEVQDG